MSGGGHPADHSVELEQMKEQAAEKERIRQAAADKAESAKMVQLRNAAMGSGRSRARGYFSEQGVNPDDYMSYIGDLLNEISSGISPDDKNPGSYYKDVGQRAFNTAETAYRGKESRTLDQLFSPNFEYQRVGDTLDDPFLQSIEGEQRQTAEQFLNNLLSRGVINPTGFAAGEKDLDRQSSGVRAKLNEIGTGALETGRQSLRDIANRGRSTASNLHLGQAFDPYSVGGDVDKAFSTFLTGLGDTLRGKVGGANLFDTSGLPVVAGAAQGAGNTPYDPKALAGLFSTDDDETKKNDRVNTSTGIF